MRMMNEGDEDSSSTSESEDEEGEVRRIRNLFRSFR